MHLRHLVAAGFAIACLAIPGAVVADCQPAGPLAVALAEAPVAFVGRVVETRGDGGQIAMIEVEERWTGAGGLANIVEVRGLGDDLQPSEDDRHWVLGGRYLVVPIVDGNVLRDSICSATTAWSDALGALRPVVTPPPASTTRTMVLLILVVVTFAAAGVAFIGYDRFVRSRHG